MNQSFLLEASALPIVESNQDRIMPGRRISQSDASILSEACIVACLVGVEVGQGRHEGVRAEVWRVVPRLLRATDQYA
jgi:hypothetical protein